MANKAHPALVAVQKSGAAKVKVACSDIDGVLRGKYLHKDKFEGAAQQGPGGGFGFCDVVLESGQRGAAAIFRASERGKRYGSDFS